MAARQDLVQDAGIKRDLLLARQGQAYFLRALNNLTDEELRPGVLGGNDRALLCAKIALTARLTADGLDKLSGVQIESDWDSIDSDAAFEDAALFTSTLPAIALRNLCAHSGVHLDVAWRDLPVPLWDAELLIASHAIPVARTPARRAREVWFGALELGAGRRKDLPADLLR